MIARLLQHEITALLKGNPAVAILGARQVGKTTLAKEIGRIYKKPSLYLDLENPVDVRKLEDPYTFLMSNKEKCLIIDEIQTIPSLFTVLRSVIDEYRINGRFIVLGSASPQLVKGVLESLAGRIAYRELSPINYRELPGSITRDKHWLRGGFPQSLTAKNNRLSAAWMSDFIKSYVERDLNFIFGVDLTPGIVRRLLNMLSHVNGSVWNAEMMARSLGITSPTVNRYLDFLEGAFLIHRLSAFYINTRKRLVKSPKIYIRDSGLLHQLSGVNDMVSLKGHPVIGSSWEGYVVEQIRQLKPSGTEMYYYRTHAGAECDVVISKGIHPVACIEIKLSNAPHISKGNLQSMDDLQAKRNFIVVPDVDEFKTTNNIIVCNIGTFLSKYLPNLK
ncbi:MAG TPA: ATP-binding protein [Agriterribacter sp.]|nr:ATP-binding protein [Agriterribacter sp.]HRQ51472.1 ATP-binding protein [Agriterribacter sp.]